jgi:hypothetical protein
MPQISHAIEMIQAKVEEWKRNYQNAGGQLPMESAAPKSYWDEPVKPQMAPQQQYGAPPQVCIIVFVPIWRGILEKLYTYI